MLLAVPNVSEGRDDLVVGELRAAFARGIDLLDVHSDPDHNRSVFTLAGAPGALAPPLLVGARACRDAIDMSRHTGVHPCIGALDVCPVVWLRPEDRDAAFAEALEVAHGIAALGIPVFLYGALAAGEGRRERAFFREGGLRRLAERMRSEGLAPDLGPPVPHERAGATLVTARPPLVAFNLELESPDLAAGRAIAGRLREGGGGLSGVRAIAVPLASGRVQISTNVHDPVAVPLAAVVAEVERLAGIRPAAAEIVGLAPAAALAGFPDDVPLHGFEPSEHVIERRLAPGAE